MIAVKWLFGERFCLETKLKPEFVMGILRDYVGKTHWQRGDVIIGPEPLFDKLTVKEEGRFVLCPSGQLDRNSFRPIWKCKLEGDKGGSKLDVRARSPGTFLFCIIWFGFVGRWGYSVLQGTASLDWFACFLGISVLFLLTGSILGFWLPEHWAKTGLQGILGGTFVKSK